MVFIKSGRDCGLAKKKTVPKKFRNIISSSKVGYSIKLLIEIVNLFRGFVKLLGLYIISIKGGFPFCLGPLERSSTVI